ncbi:Rha family transcriptional regulator [Fusobacterium necrophorum]|uniref:Rha family transcriptional regulator n=1 Tax=Fusobacterium necrophorum TaxID=859 RepID=UPI00254CA1FB|nr:Rha family transcriptional regulator [Fusobacterium necrophorum]MDK4472298.1 Rha family transcriptional regulator [Fusobacterium necrophorum]MDK4478814.1 Rha family transcriptional regulator [Fusobacterium necrophorum]MDK4517993.1 Rha family transcriptional regulator [Fusobacterium necrophorum]
MNYLVHLEKKNDIYVVSSRVIAKELGKEHNRVLKDIDKILESSDLSFQVLEKSDLTSLIIPSTYKVKGQRREYKEYLLTKDGFTLYMFNIQGYLDFKMAYINEFNRMEQALKQPKQTKLDFQEKDIIRTTWKGQPVIELVQLARYIHITSDNLHFLTKKDKVTLRYGKLMEFRNENPRRYNQSVNAISILFKETVIAICKKYGVYEKYKDFIENYFRVDNRLEDKTPKVPVVRANFDKEPFEDKYYNRMFECMKEAYIIESRIEKIYEEELLPLYNKIEELNRAKKDCLISPFNAMKYGSVLGKAKLNK